MFPTTLTTERLHLRPLRIDDADALFEHCSSDPEVTRWMSWRTNESVEETREFLRGVTDPETTGQPPWGHVWGICVEDDRPSGTIGVLPRGARVELGYVLARGLWGRGLMTEATTALCTALWENPKLWRIQAYCSPNNPGSARVLQKCGFRREGLARRMHVLPQISDEPQDHDLYALIRDDAEFAPGQ